MADRDGGGAVADRAEKADWALPVAAPSIVPALDRSEGIAKAPRSRSPRIKFPRCPEIDCVRDLVPPGIFAMAECRAAETAVGADRFLITSGAIGEETYVAALAASLNIAFEPLAGVPRERCPLPDERLAQAAIIGMLPLMDGDDVKLLVAPCLADSRRLVARAKSGGDPALRLCLTSSHRLQSFIARHAAQEIERIAVDDLRTRRPDLSAGAGNTRATTVAICAALVLITAAAVPHLTYKAIELALGFVFLAWTGLRLVGLLSERLVRRQPKTFSDDWLPTYTIIVALYREAAAAGGLVEALRAFDYPALGSKLT